MPTLGAMRGLVLTLSISLSATGFAVLQPGPATAATHPAAKAASTPDVATRPDSVSAMVSARVLHHQVEDLSQRTDSVSVFANPDGTWTEEAASGPTRVQDQHGNWHDIDTNLVATSAGLRPQYATSDVTFSDGGDRHLVELTDHGQHLGWDWPSVLPKPTVAGSTATYANVVDGGDLVVKATATGYEQYIVLRKAPTKPLQLTMPVATGDGTLVKGADGQLKIKNAKGHDLTASPAPVMWDATPGKDGLSDHVNAVATHLARNGKSTDLTLEPDQKFLSDPSTQYPVTIDPGYTITVSPYGDVWVMNTNYTTGQVSSDELRAGTYDNGGHVARSFVHFDLGMLNGKKILSSNLLLRNWYSNSCNPADIRVQRVLTDWYGPDLTWANQPGAGSTNYDDYNQAYGASGCPTADATWNLTAMTQDWANGFPNYGLRVKAYNENNNDTWRKYRSVDYGTGTGPRLVVTYDSYPNKPTTPSVASSNAGYSTTTTPKFTSTVSDPDKGSVWGNFDVYSGSTLVSSQYQKVTSGAPASVTVPAGKLSSGSTYTVKVTAWDGVPNASGSLSSPTVSSSFTVDTSVPSATVTASGYTNGQWLSAAPTSNTFSLSGPSDTASFQVSQDLASQTIKADSSGSATIAWNPTSGSHTLTVTPQDKAGNVGQQPTVFHFGAGSSSFTTPNANSNSTSVFPVTIQGAPNATGATLKWRLSGSTGWNTATQVQVPGGANWNGTSDTDPVSNTSTTGKLLWTADGEPYSDSAGNQQSLQAPALIELQGCLHYASLPDSCTKPLTVQLDSDGFGGNMPTTNVGPGSVALTTGEMTIASNDGADSNAGLARTFSSYDVAGTDTGLFGPGWSVDPQLTASLDSSATIIDNRAKDGTFVVDTPGAGSQTFAQDGTSSTHYVPVDPTGDATALTYSSGNPDTLTLLAPIGTGSVVTTWELQPSDTGGTPEWVATSANAPGSGLDDSITTDHQRITWIQESDPGTASTCTPLTQTVGCRGLKISYTGTGSATRISEVDVVVGAASQGNVQVIPVATYSYDNAGLLSTVCGTAPSSTQASLCESYTYTTSGGRTNLATMAPPGQKPWRFEYDSTGRVSDVKREQPTGGDATWTIDYSLAPGAVGLPDLSADTAQSWGQTDIPTHVYAVYAPQTGTRDVTNAALYYTTDDGTTTNTANYGPNGWLVTTNWYDQYGNVVQTLDGAGWAQVQAADAADRTKLAQQASSYTVYSADGTRVTDTYGPAHTAILSNGAPGLYRVHEANVYDDDPSAPAALVANKPTGSDPGLLVEVVKTTSDASRTSDFDPSITEYGYDPIVAGDGSGWTFGTPTTTMTQDGSGWATQTTRYDSSGKVIERRSPGGSADSTGAGNDAHSLESVYYTADGSGDCGAHPAWSGLLCKEFVSAQPSSGSPIPIKYYSNYNSDSRPTEVDELVGGSVIRKTTTLFDGLDRQISSTTQTMGSSVANSTITTTTSYNAQGLPSATSRGGLGDIALGYDSWGRPNSYVDSLGTTSLTTYNGAGEVASQSDGMSSYVYNYNDHDLLHSVDTGGATGTYTYSYSAGGDVLNVTHSTGLSRDYSYDEAGHLTGVSYSQAGSSLLSFSSSLDASGRALQSSSPESTQTYNYDTGGRLKSVQDVRDGGCVTRAYTFDGSSNRTGSTTYAPDGSSNCPQSVVSAQNGQNFDSAGRQTNSGYIFDGLGRVTAVPAADTSAPTGSTLVASFNADDSVSGLSQGVPTPAGGNLATSSEQFTYDEIDRPQGQIQLVNGAEISRSQNHYSSPGDSPSWTAQSTDGGTTWQNTRNISLPGFGLVATSSGSTVADVVANLHGDVVANVDGTGLVNAYAEYDEYGNPLDGGGSGSLGYLGVSQRTSGMTGGLISMGSRMYNPVTGQFLSPDPVNGGNSTSYGYPQDPVNGSDVSGASGSINSGGASEIYNACRDYYLQPACADVVATSIGIAVWVRGWVMLHGYNDNIQNAVRHFIWGVFLYWFGGLDFAVHIQRAHEKGSADHLDSKRDTFNNYFTDQYYAANYTRFKRRIKGFFGTSDFTFFAHVAMRQYGAGNFEKIYYNDGHRYLVYSDF